MCDACAVHIGPSAEVSSTRSSRAAHGVLDTSRSPTPRANPGEEEERGASVCGITTKAIESFEPDEQEISLLAQHELLQA